jgi:hypothetical protein
MKKIFLSKFLFNSQVRDVFGGPNSENQSDSIKRKMNQPTQYMSSVENIIII